MGNSMQEALEKAGLLAKKRDNERTRSPKKSERPKGIDTHQQQRSFCDCCRKTAPDVEYYNHKNPSLKAKWLCIICADNYFIPDEIRESNQSDFAMRGTFRRRYGKTKKF